jgi:hypothetical protein
MTPNMRHPLQRFSATITNYSRITRHRTVHSKQDEAMPRLCESSPGMSPTSFSRSISNLLFSIESI